MDGLAAAFAVRWPQHRADIEARRADYAARLGALDVRVREWLSETPRAQRRVITSHDAFGYFGAAYGVDFLTPQGWSTHSEPSAATVARLLRQIRAQGVRALFVESISDPRLLDRIAHEGGVRIGGTLYSDALSGPQGPAGTYLRLFEHNASTIARALQGARRPPPITSPIDLEGNPDATLPAGLHGTRPGTFRHGRLVRFQSP